MRNLRNSRHARYKLPERSPPLTATCFGPSDDSLVLAFGPSENSSAITLKRLPSASDNIDSATTIASWDAPSPNPDLAVDQILDLHCFPDTKTIAVILAGGDIIVIREEPLPGEECIEIVGSVDEGIKAAAWSPDEELITIASGAGTVLLMTRDFESIANINLSVDDLRVSNHVSVGWGKKETQFKGRGAAKVLRDPTVPEHVDQGTLSSLDDGRVTISWRGDGQYVAINSILDSDPRRRVIGVYSREGILESVSEPVDGLEAALSWKSSGQLLAGVQRREDRLDVVFLEKNGLRHGEFGLRLSKEEMSGIGKHIDLKWNTDSTVLAVTLRDRVQLWTMGNYHYYLKQEVMLDDTSHEPARMVWHSEKPLHFICYNTAALRRLSFGFEVCRGSVIPPNDIGLVAVIDGTILKNTPLKIANVPPPMAFDEVELLETALDVAVSEDGREIAVLHQFSVSILNCDYSAKPSQMATVVSSIPRPSADDADEEGWITVRHSNFQKLCIRSDHDRIYYADGPSGCDGEQPDKSQRAFATGHTQNLLSGDELLDCTLTDKGVLELHSRFKHLRIRGCTSYIITEDHLIYTTTQHLLKFVHHRPDEPNLDVPPDEPEKDERCRSIERGAKIVTVIPSTYALVLQMPRGNLETIYPRALVLPVIRNSLRRRKYKRAFSICRNQKVDMNILHDYAPAQFLPDVGVFVEQVSKAEYVDMFLSSLVEEDVSLTMYRDSLVAADGDDQLSHDERALTNGVAALSANGTGKQQGQATSPSNNAPHALSYNFAATSKVNRICDAFLKALPDSRLQNIVTAHVCKNPPDLENGVRLISELRKQGDEDRLEQAVEHICFLADVNQLYDTALGLYDLDVALLIAQQSQKDPREYLPYLQELHGMEQLRRQFKIDDDLKRYQKALTQLHALDAFDELEAYTIKHELYAAAIDLYRYDSTRLTRLMRRYADFLSSCNQFKEAGIAYEYISDHSAACEAYRAITMWRECLANAMMMPMPAADVASLARDLAGSLEEGKDYAGAAAIHLDYLEDLEGSARLLCRGFHFAEAMRQVTYRQQPGLLSKVVDPGLVEASATMTELLAEMKSQLSAQVPRLRELRQKKADDPMAVLDGADGGHGDVPDNISLAPTDASTSGGTFMTRYTNHSAGTLATNATRKTSKNRRREERKRARGKKGTVYEEEYLVNSVARLVERLNEVAGDIARLVEGLMRRSMRERALAVQAAGDEVFEIARVCLPEVFASGEQNHVTSQPDDAGAAADGQPLRRPWGGQGVLWDSVTSQRPEAPILKGIGKLSLLS